MKGTNIEKNQDSFHSQSSNYPQNYGQMEVQEQSSCQQQANSQNSRSVRKRRKQNDQKNLKGKWTEQQDRIYIQFLRKNREKITSKSCRKNQKIYRQLSEALGHSRTPKQCRMHHLRMKRSTRSINTIVNFLSRKHLKQKKNINLNINVDINQDQNVIINNPNFPYHILGNPSSHQQSYSKNIKKKSLRKQQVCLQKKQKQKNEFTWNMQSKRCKAQQKDNQKNEYDQYLEYLQNQYVIKNQNNYYGYNFSMENINNQEDSNKKQQEEYHIGTGNGKQGQNRNNQPTICLENGQNYQIHYYRISGKEKSQEQKLGSQYNIKEDKGLECLAQHKTKLGQQKTQKLIKGFTRVCSNNQINIQDKNIISLGGKSPVGTHCYQNNIVVKINFQSFNFW